MAIMTSEEYVRRLFVLAGRNSYYSNKYPYNLCYIHPDGRTSADCWNLIKAILNGYDVNNTSVGYYQKSLSNTGDVDGLGLLSKCSDVSADFSKLKSSEPRLLYMAGHAGSYVGTFENNGKTYNVIECTGSWERKILFSWVDSDGVRRRWKGGVANGRWAKHGKMTAWLAYGSDPKKETCHISLDLPILKKGDTGKAVKLWQMIVGASADGIFGPATEKATKGFQNTKKIAIDGIVGHDSWTSGLEEL